MKVDLTVVVLLAVIQGMTEFLPVSSSGHLVLAESLVGLRTGGSVTGVVFEVAVHVGTLGAIVLVYRRKILSIFRALVSFISSGFRPRVDESGNVRYVGLILLGSIPVAVVGLFSHDRIESLFDSPRLTSVFLIVTGLFLLLSKKGGGSGRISVWTALAIGVAQAVAVLPGCSRSGWTITVALLAGLGFERAAEFSFLLSIPAILGALVLETARGSFSPCSTGFFYLLIGAAVAFISGWIALRLLLGALVRGNFYRFAYYLVPAGAAALLYFSLTR